MSSRLLPLLILTLIGSPALVLAKTTGAINRVSTTQKVVALTFDADMNPKMQHELDTHAIASWYNKTIIDELRAAHVPATLFLTGMWIEDYATTTAELARDPLFELGNHSYSHPAFSSPCYKLGTDAETDDTLQITKTDRLLAAYEPHHPMFFRFPGLCHDADDVTAVTNAGYATIDGDVHGGDGFQKNASVIVSNVVGGVHPGSIIVLHMMGGPNAPKTAEALPLIIKTLRSKGYSFVTVSDLLKLRQKN